MPKNPGDVKHCLDCNRWHEDKDLCFPKMQKKFAAMEAKVELCNRMFKACEKGIRELVSRPYNTQDEDKMFREMLKIIKDSR